MCRMVAQVAYLCQTSLLVLTPLYVRFIQRLFDGIPEPRRIEALLRGGFNADHNLSTV